MNQSWKQPPTVAVVGGGLAGLAAGLPEQLAGQRHGLGPARGSHPGAGGAPRPAAPGPGQRVQAVLKRAMSSTS